MVLQSVANAVRSSQACYTSASGTGDLSTYSRKVMDSQMTRRSLLASTGVSLAGTQSPKPNVLFFFPTRCGSARRL